MEPGTIRIRGVRRYFWLAFYEWLGSALFLFFINYSSGNGVLVVTGLFIAAIITARVGGGHYNAAVTTSVFIVEYKNWRKNLSIAGTIYVSDILGAYTGIAVACGL